MVKSKKVLEYTELFYIQFFTNDHKSIIFSSKRGEIYLGKSTDLLDIFKNQNMAPVLPQSKIMIHLLEKPELVTDSMRLKLITDAKKQGHLIIRFEDSKTLLTPEEAFGLLLIPFT